MIVLKNISVSIGNMLILKDISCTIYPQDCIVLIGTNGAGKSTFFDILTGKRKPDQGSIFFNGKDVTHLNEQARALFVARLFQNPQLNGVSSMTVEQNLALSMYKGKKVGFSKGIDNIKDLSYLSDVFDGVTIKDFLKIPMHALSGGQRQLLAFIMAISAMPPQLLLLDEPTAALDPVSATNLLKYTLNYIKTHAITTLVVTHDPQLALTIGNKIWVIQDGQLVRQYNHHQKSALSATDLIGAIDYNALIT